MGAKAKVGQRTPVLPPTRQMSASQRQTAMLEAAKAGHESEVAHLLALDPGACTTDGYQLQPLLLAAKYGHDGVVARLLAHNPQLSDATDYGESFTSQLQMGMTRSWGDCSHTTLP